MSFSEGKKQKVWEKGKSVPPNDPKVWRKDQCGAWIKRSEHGNRESKFGWEIDHIDAKGGDDLSNLRPLQWENNVATGEDKLKCVVTSEGTKNVDKE